MIPADLIFITPPSTTDFTGPAIGIVGVLIGSAAGFFSLRYQLKAQRDFEIRRLGANLIAAGEELRDDYLEKQESGVRPIVLLEYLAQMRSKVDEMTRIHRHIELIAPGSVNVAAHVYWLASFAYSEFATKHYGQNKRPEQQLVDEASLTWIEARDKLISALNPQRGKPTLRQRIRFALNNQGSQRQLKKDIAALIEAPPKIKKEDADGN